MSMWDT